MTLFITGASGFIGRHVLSRALAAGHFVRALVAPSQVETMGDHPRQLLIPARLHEVCDTQLAGCDAMIHLAAHGVGLGMNDWEQCFRVNVSESLILWKKAVEVGIKRFVICGSCFEYGRSGERYEFIPVNAPLEPTGAYHASKAAATMAALGLAVDKKLELVVLRPFHVYGEGESEGRFWPSLRRAALAGLDFRMTTGTQVRDFVAVQRVAAAFVEAAVGPGLNAGDPVIRNEGTGKPCTLLEFARDWWVQWNAPGRLLVGAVPQRSNEVLRYVPEVAPRRE